MQTYDFVMLAVLLVATVFGAWKGLAWQVASLASIFLSYLVAVQFREAVAPMINATPPWNVFLAMLILYVGSSLVIWILFRFVSAFIDRVKLKEFDRQFGALFGLAKGVVLCVIITLFAVTLLGESQKQSVIDSYSGHYIARLLDKAHGVMPEEVHDVLHPYVHRLDRQWGAGAGGAAPQAATPESGLPAGWDEAASQAANGLLERFEPRAEGPFSYPENGAGGDSTTPAQGVSGEPWTMPMPRQAEQPSGGGGALPYRPFR